jgi:DNA polymerase-3 subunit epsilon
MISARLKLLARHRATALDFETTGSVPGYPNQPWQIGWVEVDSRGILPDTADSAWLQVPAERPFNRFAPGRHAQIRDELAIAPTLPDLWPRLQPLLLRRPLIAHNAATERNVLTRAFPLHRFGPWIDTLALSRRAWPNLPSYALEDLMHSLGLAVAVSGLCPGLAPHDARYDAVAAALLLCHILAQPGWNNLELDDLQRLL